MPIIQSAIKRMRQNEARRVRRKPVKTLMKSMMRKMHDLKDEGKIKEATALLPTVYKAIDMAAKNNIIHTSNAAHKKSHMAKLVATK